MNKLILASAFIAVLALQTPAGAATITILPPGQLSNGGVIATFDGQPQTPYLAITPAVPFSDGGASFTGDGLIMKNPGQPSAGLYAEPLHDTTNYLAILGGRSETITYTGPRHSFGFYWGSIDEYNTVAFYTNVGDLLPFLTYTGGQISPLIPNGNQVSDNSNRYVVFSDLVFSKVVLSSGTNSFELDNVTAGVPEPSTWIMMLMGFAGVAFMAHRRAKARPAAKSA